MRDPICEVLEEVGVLAGDDAGGGFRDSAVVGRVPEIVRAAGRREVELQVEVDFERLRSLAFLGQDAVGARGP